MKYADVVYAGAPISPAGLPTEFSLKGFRVAPVLSAGATFSDVVAAYASLVVRVARSSQSRSISGVTPVGITDDVSVVGPDWHRSPGFNTLQLVSGQVGVTYRVWWAEDCLEMLDPGALPAMEGFASGGIPAQLTPNYTNVGPAGAATQALASTANIPSLSTDGVALRAGTKGMYAVVQAAAGQTITVAGQLVWWRWSGGVGRWIETAVQEVPPTGRRDVMGAEQLVMVAGGVGGNNERVYCEARNVNASGGANLTVTIITA